MFGFGRVDANVSLYCKRVLIDAKPEGLLPEWLRFLNGVVDSEDLPLNISREMLQDNSLVRKISDIITRRFIKHLEKLAKDDKETYREFYAQFSRYLKEGVVTSWPNKESLGKLLRFESTSTEPGETTSFEEYLTRMKEGQTAIYALTGPSRSHLENSPYLEAFKARGYEVAFFTDHGDEFVLDSLSSVDGKPVTMIDRADVELPALEEEQKDALPQEEAAALEEWLKGLYPDKFSKVTLGKRLVSGAAVALQSGNDMGPEMRAYMKAMGQEVPESHPQLELNPSNPLVKKLSALRTENPELAQMVGGPDREYRPAPRRHAGRSRRAGPVLPGPDGTAPAEVRAPKETASFSKAAPCPPRRGRLFHFSSRHERVTPHAPPCSIPEAGLSSGHVPAGPGRRNADRH